jgi:predicted PurR-regulated permease PerM
MSDQVTNKSTVAAQNQQRVTEIALPSSISTSDRLLSRIATLLFLLVAGMLTVFGYYASSICFTVVLAAFLAILFDPVVVKLEKLRLPRGVAAAVVVLAGMGLIGLLGQQFYGRGVTLAEGLPVYISKHCCPGKLLQREHKRRRFSAMHGFWRENDLKLKGR